MQRVLGVVLLALAVSAAPFMGKRTLVITENSGIQQSHSQFFDQLTGTPSGWGPCEQGEAAWLEPTSSPPYAAACTCSCCVPQRRSALAL